MFLFGLSLAEVHAAMVHIPIVMLPLGVLVELFGLTRAGRQVGMAGFYLMLIGWLGAGAAVISGWQVQGNAQSASGAASLLFWHRLNGLVIVGLFGLMLLARASALRLRSAATGADGAVMALNLSWRQRLAYAGLGIVGLILVLIQGYLGGRMVYHFGIV